MDLNYIFKILSNKNIEKKVKFVENFNSYKLEKLLSNSKPIFYFYTNKYFLT